MYRSILKIMALCLVLLGNVCSFGMIVRYKNEETKRRVKASIASCLESLEKKQVRKLSLEEQGKYNLEKLYKHRNNPKFVQKFLSDKDRYVPIVLVAPFVYLKQPKHAITLIVNPYEESFYANHDKKLLNEKIIGFGKQKLQAIKQKNLFAKNFSEIHTVNSPLVTASLFGSDKDIQKALISNADFDAVHNALIMSIKYPNQKNKALELLASEMKQRELHFNGIQVSKGFKIINSYMLLCLAVASNSKEAFELVSNKDPFNANMLSDYVLTDQFKKGTNFDLVIDNKEFFGQENINIFRDNGGWTAREIDFMEDVDRILKDPSPRRIPTSPLFDLLASVMTMDVTEDDDDVD